MTGWPLCSASPFDDVTSETVSSQGGGLKAGVGVGRLGKVHPRVCAAGLTSSEPRLGPAGRTGADEETKAQSGGRAQVRGPLESYTSVGVTCHAGRKMLTRENVHFSVVKGQLSGSRRHRLPCSSSVQHRMGPRNCRTAGWAPESWAAARNSGGAVATADGQCSGTGLRDETRLQYTQFRAISPFLG